MKQSSVVASLQGVTLYQCDYNLIQSGWFNDNLICFHIEYIKEYLHLSNKILLLDPLTFIMLSFSPNASLLDDYDAKSYEYIIITVNDLVDNNTPNNGSHWTLLLCDITQQKVYYYDSVPSHSHHHVDGLLLKLNKYFSKTFQFIKAKCPIQTNSYDCGPHILINMNQLCTMIEQSKLKFETIQPTTTAKEMREEIKKEINNTNTTK
ncbi:Ulp1 protease family [Entamoeba marina]